MGNFKDFDLDLNEVKTNSQSKSRYFTFDLECLHSVAEMSKKMCSNPSTHCSPSDRGECRNGEPGKLRRC